MSHWETVSIARVPGSVGEMLAPERTPTGTLTEGGCKARGHALADNYRLALLAVAGRRREFVEFIRNQGKDHPHEIAEQGRTMANLDAELRRELGWSPR